MANVVRQQPLFIMRAVLLLAVAYTALMVVPSCMVLTDGARVFNPVATDKAPSSASCKALASVCAADKECCSESCLLFVCVLPYEKKLEMEGLMQGNTAHLMSKEIALQAAPEKKAPSSASCKALASVCTTDKECCSKSCLLFVCVLSYDKNKMEGVMQGNAAHLISNEIALQAATEKAPTCLPIGGVFSKDKDCCSDSCLLFLCTLPYEHNQLEAPINMDSNNKVAIREKAPSCLPIGGVCSKDKDCCSGSCLLFLCTLPYEEKKLEEVDNKRVAIPGINAPTCKALASVCKLDEECCSESCLLFVCVLPYEKNKIVGLVEMARTKVALQEKAPTCLPVGGVCSNDKDCCSDSCLLFLCTLPYERNQLETPSNMDSNNKVVILGIKAPTCKALASVCKLDEECCSESCLLFVCVLPYEKNEIVGLVEMSRTKVALQENAPTCLPISGVCSKDKDCCSDSCLLFLCTLPYERNQLEAPINMDSNNKVAILGKAPTCLPIGGVCSKDTDCCSDSCLLFLCTLPYVEKEKLEAPIHVDNKKVAPEKEKGSTCLPIGSVCSKDKDCCSDSCLLLICVLPYMEDNKGQQ